MSNIIDIDPVSPANAHVSSGTLTNISGANLNLEKRRPTSLSAMAAHYDMSAETFKQTLLNTVVPKGCSNEQFAVFIGVAGEYDLNPLTKEIYAFPARGGGIQPIVSIDGWMKIINRHPAFDGMVFQDNLDGAGKLQSITCTIHRKDRAHPISATEYLGECAMGTDPWKKYPARMLRHKAAIQAARYAFGFSGIIDPDEYERMQSNNVAPADSTPITDEQRDHLLHLLHEYAINIEKFCAYLGISNVASLRATDYQRALTAINRSIAARKQAIETQGEAVDV